jgi:aspartate/methionine/tyrosine aminotransferase
MEWAKLHSKARFNLATSGVANYKLADLPVKVEDLEISGPSSYGYEPLQELIAAKYGIPVECVVAATGTSGANHLAMATILEPGDEVVVEHPTYDPLIGTALNLGAEVKRFRRMPEAGFRIELTEVERSITPRTRLIVLSNLHNPTSVLTDNESLQGLAAIAKTVGARVLVDEVYLDSLFQNTPASSFHLSAEQFVVTSSLTKVYGLSGLRCGWILAEPALAKRMWRLNDLFGNIPAHAAELLSCVALSNLNHIAAQSKARLERNHSLLTGFLARHQEQLHSVDPQYGTVVFPRLVGGRVDDFCNLLREEYETSVVPGIFFEMLDHFRIGIGGDTEMVEEGLERLGTALDKWVS